MKTVRQLIRNLSEAVVDCPNGIFVKVLPTYNAFNKISGNFWELEHIQPLVEDMHCTVIYSKTAGKDIKLPAIDKHARFKALCKEVVFWPGHDDEGYVVCLLESEDLQALHKQFRDAGLEPTFPDYKPHVSMLHPVKDGEDLQRYMRYTNQMLKNRKPELTFYYGGYVIMDAGDEDAK